MLIIKHPHLIPYLAVQFERLVSGVLDRRMARMEAAMNFQLSVWKDMFPQRAAEIDSIATGPALPMTTGADGQTRPQTVAETLDLSSDDFIARLTDVELAKIHEMHQNNGNYVQGVGYYHMNAPTPEQATAFVNPWHVTYQQPNGQWAQQPVTHDIYSTPNNGYPSAAPGGMANPWAHGSAPPGGQPASGGPGVTGALVGLGMQWLAGGQQQGPQYQYQAPPPQRPYYY
jgi:hypothetical protein